MKDLAGLSKLICLCFKLSPITSFVPKKTYTSPLDSWKPLLLSHVNLLLTINVSQVRDPFQGKDIGCKSSSLIFLKRSLYMAAFIFFLVA